MDYKEMAEELLKIRSEWSHVAANEELARLTKGEFFVLNYLTDHGGTAFPKALSREMKVSTARIAAESLRKSKGGLPARRTVRITDR